MSEQTLSMKSLDLSDTLRNPIFKARGYRVRIVDTDEFLLISEKEVIWTKGALTLKRLRYDDEPIIDAVFTNFGSEGKCLTVALREHAHVYYADSRKHIISFPFHVKNVFPYVNGLLIEKEPAKASSANNISTASSSMFDHSVSVDVNSIPLLSSSISSSLALPSTATSIGASDNSITGKIESQINFLTLNEPLGEYGTLVSSSTSSISKKESLTLFPKHANESLAVTFNSGDNMISIYHVRYLSHNSRTTSSRKNYNGLSMSSGSKTLRRPPSLRKPSSSLTPMKMGDEDDFMLDAVNTPAVSRGQLNYEKLRFVSETLSIDRMASGTEIIPDSIKPTSHFETSTLRKDIILTKLESIAAKDDKKYLSFHSSFYNGQQCIVINNKKTNQSAIMIFKKNNNSGLTLLENYTIPCFDCAPLDPSCGYEGLVVILKDGSNMFLANPFIGLVSANIELKPGVVAIHNSFDSEIALAYEDSSFRICSLLIKPKSKLILKIFDCLKYLSNSFSYEYFWMQWSTALGFFEDLNEWKAFVVVLLAVIIPDDSQFDEGKVHTNEITELLPHALNLKSKREISYSLSELSAKIVISLHLIREDMKLDLRRSKNVVYLSILLSQLTLWMGWSHEWQTYYGCAGVNFDKVTRFLALEPMKNPLNLFQSLASLFDDNQIVPYLPFSQIASENESVDEVITPRTYYVLRLFEVMVSEEFSAVDVVNLMIEFGIKVEDLDTYPVSISIPLKESILICQINTPVPWTEPALELVGRKDILRFLNNTEPNMKGPKIAKNEAGGTGVRDIARVLQSHDDTEASAPWDGQVEADRINITKLIFSQDRRFLEITTLLQSSRLPTVHPCFSSSSLSEGYDKEHLFYKAVSTITVLRTLSIPLGRGALFLSSRLPLMTERFPIPKLNFNCLIPTSEQTLSLDKESVDSQAIQWGFFHNGASSGLTISRDAEDVSGGWVVFNQPPVLNAQHAGFLLGLGLNGHLKNLDQWHIYNYLGPKHTYTSIGLLLGMSASLKGTMNVTLTKVLSVHVVALLPMGATDLKVSVSVQTAGLIGIGLLYLETQHHRMSEILLSQIYSKLKYDDDIIADEGYRLAAGISLGYINLGKGDTLKGPNDTHLVESLLMIAVSLKDVQTEDHFDKSASGAILALSFIYMKTHNARVSEKLSLPETEQLLDYVRPDLLLLRCLAKNLILWDKIKGTDLWVQSQIPSCLSKKFSISKIHSLDSDQLSFYNIIGGACLSVALRYASSMNKEVMKVVLYYLEEMMRITSLPVDTHDQRIAKVGASSIRDIIAISCSIVMAGSGNLDIFRRLRLLYGKIEPHTTYGNFMATNMALGFLFLGGGQYAFSNSSFAIASLVTAVYPIFPVQSQAFPTTNDVHLQALRHFWALSVEPRCLIIRDVETFEPVKTPVKLRLSNGDVLETQCPGMIPSLDEIVSIETMSNDYLKINYNFKVNKDYFDIFKKKLTLYVYRKENIQSKNSFGLLMNKSEFEKPTTDIINPLAKSTIYNSLHVLERGILYNATNNARKTSSKSFQDETEAVKLELLRMAESPKSIEDLWNLKILFKFSDNFIDNDLQYLGTDFIEKLKISIWKLTNS